MTEQTGTKEWSKYSRNIFRGCSHNCRYCFARANALEFKQIAKPEEWPNMVLNQKAYSLKPKKLNGRIMTPSTHDILPQHAFMYADYLKGWLEVGNDMLIVTKPHAAVVLALCASLKSFRDQLTFRFTIGSIDNDVLKFWEPGAPSFEERLECLKWARAEGYETSVSCEPFLDRDIRKLVSAVEPYVTNTIWIGLMNRIEQRVDTTGWSDKDLIHLFEVRKFQSKQEIERLYQDLKDNPKLRWKDSIKKMLGLPGEEIG